MSVQEEGMWLRRARRRQRVVRVRVKVCGSGLCAGSGGWRGGGLGGRLGGMPFGDVREGCRRKSKIWRGR